jgi:hypothetical protein
MRLALLRRRSAVLLTAGASTLALAMTPGALPAQASPAGSVTPQILCQIHGTVVFMQYASWDKPPASNGCWTIIKPLVAPDNSSYVDCDMSAATPHVSGAGSNWIYDDTNKNGHKQTNGVILSDQTLNNTYMSASGGFIERWSPTFLFEENYTGTHAWVAFTQSVTYAGSNPTVGPIPTIDTATSSVSSHITAECHDAPDYPSDYWFSIYNGTPVSSGLVDTIDNALNSCYHS